MRIINEVMRTTLSGAMRILPTAETHHLTYATARVNVSLC